MPEPKPFPVPAIARENREGGENPPRAQRCQEDSAGKIPLAQAGKGSAGEEPKPEDRPETQKGRRRGRTGLRPYLS
ncbi:hypothetical protein GALL_88110 [mine drainage metagenome]|uniref:Uncharacterized protein n=1 Tax=mine drainage metagenome TaxID=410659 RepID=A0A1J5T5W6_9ZZZZ